MDFTHDIYDIPIIQEIVISSTSGSAVSTILFPRAKTIPINKGYTSNVSFHVRDQNKKIKNVAGLNLVARLYNVDQTVLLIEKPLLNTDLAQGVATLVFTPNDIQDLEPGLYNLYVSLGSQQTNTVLYHNRTYDSNLTVEIVQGGSITNNSQEITTFYNTSDASITESQAIEAQASKLLNRGGLATFAVYMTNFVGSIFLDATLELHPNSTTNYFPIPLYWAHDEYKYNNFSGLDPHNVVCFASFVKFKIKTTSGTVDKIIFRG